LDEQLEGLKSATIMIVDDDSTTVEVLEAFLEGEGYTELVTLTDSRRAVETLSAQGADVLLLDLQMPNVDGFEVLQQIRNDEKLRQLPVIMLSAATDAGTKLKALELGATDFLTGCCSWSGQTGPCGARPPSSFAAAFSTSSWTGSTGSTTPWATRSGMDC